MNPGNSGTSKTRALVCELLAIKLLKEFSTRELVRDMQDGRKSVEILTLDRSVGANQEPAAHNDAC